MRAFPQLWIGGFLLITLALASFLAPVIAPYDPTEIGLGGRLESPSRTFFFGTDRLGRDVFSRNLYAGRISLLVSLTAVMVGMFFGVLIGLAGGYQGGKIDSVLMRLIDGLLAFPNLILAITIGFALGPSFFTIVIALSVVLIPSFARVARAQTLQLKAGEFVVAARSIGASPARIVLRHILPNLTTVILVQMSLGASVTIFAEASLSFLGLGVPPPNPTWGGMLRDGYAHLETSPFLPIVTGVFIFLAVLAFNFVGDGLRDILDPQQRRQRGT